MFPPHERGWTLDRCARGQPGVVSPARAGMDPVPQLAENRGFSFPRTSGDGPRAVAFEGRCSRFPPHERGWTPSMGRVDRRVVVSPARAGMDLRNSASGSVPWRFPRTSWDGPKLSLKIHEANTFPPHERGWTRVLAGVDVDTGVSPARAGMDRRRSPGTCGDSRFPRTSGDGPCQSDRPT